MSNCRLSTAAYLTVCTGLPASDQHLIGATDPILMIFAGRNCGLLQAVGWTGKSRSGVALNRG